MCLRLTFALRLLRLGQRLPHASDQNPIGREFQFCPALNLHLFEKLRWDMHAPGFVEFNPELPRQRRGRNAGSSNDVARANDFAIGELDFAGANVFHVDVIPDLHAETFELALRAGREVGWQMREDEW